MIGEFGSLTGKYAQYGISTRNGIALAVDQANHAGGILGKKIRLVVEDDQGEPEKAQLAVSKLISKDRVVSVLGEVASSRTLAGAPVCQQNRIPLISPAASDPRVTQVGNYIFRACFIDPFQGRILAEFVSHVLKLSRVAILRDATNSYSTGIADAFSDSFRNSGGAIVADQKYNEGDADFTAQLVTIRSVEPQAIIVPGYYKDGARIVVKARELGLLIPLIGADAWDNPEMISLAGHSLRNCYFSGQYSHRDPNEQNRVFVAAYKSRYHQKPDAFAALGYDSAGLLFNAIQRAGSIRPGEIQKILESTRSYPGVTGSISFDSSRNPVKPGVIFKYSNDKFEYFTTVSP